MISEKRILAARANGARSRGPKTPEGKARSSRNAIRHGLLASCVVLPTENRQVFQSLFEMYIARFGPVDDVEMGLIEEMVASHWRRRRAMSIERDLLDAAMDKQTNRHLDRMAAAFCDPETQPNLNLLFRYESRLFHIHSRALRDLAILRRDLPPKTDAPIPPEIDYTIPNEPTNSFDVNETGKKQPGNQARIEPNGPANEPEGQPANEIGPLILARAAQSASGTRAHTPAPTPLPPEPGLLHHSSVSAPRPGLRTTRQTSHQRREPLPGLPAVAGAPESAPPACSGTRTVGVPIVRWCAKLSQTFLSWFTGAPREMCSAFPPLVFIPAVAGPVVVVIIRPTGACFLPRIRAEKEPHPTLQHIGRFPVTADRTIFAV